MKTRIRMIIYVELHEGMYDLENEEEKLYLENEVLVGDGTLLLHSNDMGETIGVVKQVTQIEYQNIKP